MEVLLAALVGLLVAAGAWLMMAGTLVRFLFGLVLLSNAANLAIFAAGRLTYAAPPLIAEGALAPAGLVGNALPQALILTAIVIGFGLFAFALALSFRAYNALGTARMNDMRLAEPPHDDAPAAGEESAR
jgi:multicomponent Na+:H+ antiporter subunit C